jgi:fimbrial chaperone protein
MIRSYLIFSGLVLLILTQFSAQAALMISPTRVVFSERDRAQELVLINSGNKATTYRLEWLQKKALPGGGYAELTQEDEINFPTASQMMRFSPKQVSLQPGERQIIKLVLRKPKGLKDGEYRSHLLFRALPAPRDATSETGGMSMTLNLHMSYSLPVTVRQGKSDTKVSFAGYTFSYDSNNNQGQLRVGLNKGGMHSSFGNILAYWTPAKGGAEQMIARVNAYSVYPELSQAQSNLVWLDKDFSPYDGKLILVYEGTGEYRGQTFSKQTYTHTSDMFTPANQP